MDLGVGWLLCLQMDLVRPQGLEPRTKVLS